MAKTDWKNSDVVKAQDMNDIGEEINQLQTEIEERFDTTKTDSVTLQPGLQVVNAAKDARFRLGEVRGRTLINLLGSAGSFDSLTGWSVVGTAAIDTTNKVEGSGCAAITVTNGQYADIFQRFSYNPSKNYIAVARVKMVSGVAMALRMNDNAVPKEMKSPLMSTLNKFETVFIRVPANFFTGANIVYISALLSGPNDSSGYVDALRVYEISDAEYAAFDGMTPEQVAAKYPFVHAGIRGVDGPYAIATSDNLLPPFYEWTADVPSQVRILSPYKIQRSNVDVEFRSIITNIDVIPGETYTLSINTYETGAYVTIWGTDKKGSNVILQDAIGQGTTGISSRTFTIPSEYKRIIVGLMNQYTSGMFTFENPSLIVGSEPKPFQPQCKSILAFQTELHANPEDSSEPDVLFKKDEQYFKLAKWKKYVLDDSFSYEYADYDNPGFKGIRFPHGSKPIDRSSIGTKYDGKVLTEYGGVKAADKITIDGLYIYIWILNVDSGWGDSAESDTFSGDGSTRSFRLTTANSVIPTNLRATIEGVPTTEFTIDKKTVTFSTAPAVGTNIVVSYVSAYFPTPDEIKAYFLGWRMRQDGTISDPYTSGKKFWRRITDNEGVTDVLPVTSYEGFTPYQLLYRLAKENVEPVVSEGCLTLTEGDNVVEVGTGIVLRENVKPVNNGESPNPYYVINQYIHGSALKNKTNRILTVHTDGRVDYGWNIRSNQGLSWSYGGADAVRFVSTLDSTNKVFDVTYIKLDKSPIQPITGSLAANEKAQISDLTAGVVEALQRVSVVEVKKSDEDAPGWIAPTLLSAWVNYDTGYFSQAGYYKEGDRVWLKGLVKDGILNAPIFKLPSGHRPKGILLFSVVGGNNDFARVDIDFNGNVFVSYASSLAYISLNGISFRVGQ
ncbi:hypothetical protein EHV15_06960 [Paenibacillus oralis]|uniref:Uncharacterized protein n=1 Tax=Paenibacillus oralis TaxID=2490856 RepID=A0A3P3TXZ2_9BACL|nr:hypothetical protein [Paenibacillus oralis]RRJ62710.1 hypothetical protein EHV15_06960 [Paenibacillus oralis]